MAMSWEWLQKVHCDCMVCLKLGFINALKKLMFFSTCLLVNFYLSFNTKPRFFPPGKISAGARNWFAFLTRETFIFCAEKKRKMAAAGMMQHTMAEKIASSDLVPDWLSAEHKTGVSIYCLDQK